MSSVPVPLSPIIFHPCHSLAKNFAPSILGLGRISGYTARKSRIPGSIRQAIPDNPVGDIRHPARKPDPARPYYIHFPNASFLLQILKKFWGTFFVSLFVEKQRFLFFYLFFERIKNKFDSR